MTSPSPDFVVKVNQARHDQVFQILLVRSGFGQHFMAKDGETGVLGSIWRGNTYILKELNNLPPDKPDGLYMLPPDL